MKNKKRQLKESKKRKMDNYTIKIPIQQLMQMVMNDPFRMMNGGKIDLDFNQCLGVLTENFMGTLSEVYLQKSEQKKICSSKRRRYKHLHKCYLLEERKECLERNT